jgi:hypothetical protein
VPVSCSAAFLASLRCSSPLTRRSSSKHDGSPTVLTLKTSGRKSAGSSVSCVCEFLGGQAQEF